MSDQDPAVPSEPSDLGAADAPPPPPVSDTTVAAADVPPPPPPAGYGAGTAAYPTTQGPVDASKKIPAGILGILLGWLGVHKFYLGYTKEGVIMLILGIVTCGAVSGIIGLIEGIIYLTKPDQEFYDTYIANKKGWF